MQRTSHLGSLQLPDDEEIAPSCEPSEELKFFKVQDQRAIHEEEEEEEIPEGEEKEEEQEGEGEVDCLPIPRLPGAIIPFVTGGWAQFGLRARICLDRIADHHNLDQARRRQLVRAFANYVIVPKSHLGLSTTGDDARCVSLASHLPDDRFMPTRVSSGELSEIALRLEPAICREARSQRTLGQQRKFLAAHRGRMRRDWL
jgi:hypothetical protein